MTSDEVASGRGRARKPPAQAKRTHSVTLREVAEAASVSVATVSLVMNNKPDARISRETRQRVQDAARTLGYRPNALAKTLVSGGSRFIGLVTDAIASTPFAGQIIRGAQDEAWKQGYILLVANTEGNEDAEREAISMLLEHQVKGILYSTWYHRSTEVPAALRETEFVLVNCFSPAHDARAVVPDEVQGGLIATRLLLDAGHRRIAILNTTTPSPAHDGRLQGYREALDEAGVPFDPKLVFDTGPDQSGGFAIVDALLASAPTAVFCHNDRVAMGLYDGLRERGVSVPDQLAVVGFDNQEVIAAHLRPPLSTVALPHYELGVVGVRILLGLEGVAEDGTLKLKCPAVERSSIAPAPRAASDR